MPATCASGSWSGRPILEDPEKAYNEIKAVVPETAGITDIFFDADTGEVLIEAEKPGVVIGKNGTTLRDITRHIGWTPKVVRTPPIESSTVKQIRQYLRSVNEERKQFLRTIGRRIHRDIPGKEEMGKDATKKDQWIRVTMLGCCREVGRAAFLLTTPNSRVLIDCGEKPDNAGGTPYLYVPEIHPLAQLDAVVLTHAHLDHCALIPLLYKYGYEGPVYSTPPTRDLSAMLQLDYLDVINKEDRKIPYSSQEVKTYIQHSITLNYGSVTDIAPDIKLTFHNAGHILGSAIAHFHVGDGMYNIAFTGDFNYAKSRSSTRPSTSSPGSKRSSWRARTAAAMISSSRGRMPKGSCTRRSTRSSSGAGKSSSRHSPLGVRRKSCLPLRKACALTRSRKSRSTLTA